MFNKTPKTYFAKAFLRRPGQTSQIGIGMGTFGTGLFSGIFLMAFPYLVFGGSSLFFKALFWIFLIGSFAGIIASYKYARRYIQGIEGEKLVHDELEPIIREGYHIINAFPGDGFDIDFIVIGPTGVYAIEVKNPSKFAADDWIVLENGTLKIKSAKAKATIPLRHKDPIKQARHNADWLKRYIAEIMGRHPTFVKATILFPRFLVKDYSENDLLIFNPKRFITEHLSKAPQTLSPGDITNILTALRARIKTLDDFETSEN